MEKNKFAIGVDFGSDSARALLIDACTGENLASAVKNYPRWAKGLWCDARTQQFRQHPLDYLDCLEDVLQRVVKACPDPSQIISIGIDSTGSTPCFTDREGTPLSLKPEFAEDPDAMFILWKDHTGVKEAEEIALACSRHEPNYACQSGNHYSSECTWAKVLHTLRKNSRIREAAWCFIDECDWLTNVLTGCKDFDQMKWGHCIPGAKQLWNADWGGYPPISLFEEIDPLMVPIVEHTPAMNYSASTIAGTLCPEWAGKLGLGTNVIISTGNCDAHSGAVGAGVRTGKAVLNMGTSACYMAVMPAEQMKGQFIDGLFGQSEGTILEGYKGYETGLSAFGDIFAWYKRLLSWPVKHLSGWKDDQDELDRILDNLLPALAEEASHLPLSEDLPCATDYFNGRRSPNPSNFVTASISRLRITSTAPEIYHALVEAAAFASKACIDQYLDGGIVIDSMVAVGGIAQKSPFVMQLLCDVLGSPVEVSGCKDACAMGAAIHSTVAAGLYPDVIAAEDALCPPCTASYKPDAERHTFYMHRYEKYKALSEFTEKHI